MRKFIRRKLLISIAIFCLCVINPAVIHGQGPQTQKVLSWEDRNKDQPYIVLFEEHKNVLSKDWSFETLDHYRVKIQKDEARYLGEIPVSYNKSLEDIKSIEAFVITPDGKTHPYTKIQDIVVYDGFPMYSDCMRKIITLPNVVKGAVIEWKIKAHTKKMIMENQNWGSVSMTREPTKEYRDIYVIPADLDIPSKSYKNALKPKVIRKDSTITYIFGAKETESTSAEEYCPPSYETHGFYMFSSIKNWSDVADWYKDLVNRNTVDDEAIKRQTDEIINGKITQLDRARAIFEYLQDNFRYVSMSFGKNSVEPHQTSEVFNNRYGDCKDQCVLARQMLNLAGIKANIALFCGEFDWDPQIGLPAPSYFDHVMLEVFLDGKSYFVDPLLKGYDIGQVPYLYENGTLFVITDNSYRFERIPIASERQHYTWKETNIFIQDDGSATFEIRSLWSLDLSLQTREFWNAATEQQKEELYASLDEVYTKGGKIIERKREGMDDRYGQIKSYIKYKDPNAFPIVNGMILINESGYGRILEFAKKERKNPIFYPTNSLEESVTYYHIPGDFKIEPVPEGYDLKMGIFEVAKTFEVIKDVVKVTSIMRTKRNKIEVEKYQEVKDFWNTLAQKRNKYIVLKRP